MKIKNIVLLFIVILLITIVLNTHNALACRGCVNLIEGEFSGYSQVDENGFIKANAKIEWDDIFPLINDVELKAYNKYGEERNFAESEKLSRKFEEMNKANLGEDIENLDKYLIRKSNEAVKNILKKARDAQGLIGTFPGIYKTNEGKRVAWVKIEDGNINEVNLFKPYGEEYKNILSLTTKNADTSKINLQDLDTALDEIEELIKESSSGERYSISLKAIEEALISANWQ